jgi:glycosyltransferase involved in cell wall biosynthesis
MSNSGASANSAESRRELADGRDTTRVLHVVAPAGEGGLEQVVTMLARGQRSGGVHVASVITPTHAQHHPFTQRLDALRIPNTKIVVGARQYRRELRMLRQLVALLRPSVIHTHGFRADVTGGMVARSCGLPAVSTVHGFTGLTRRIRFYEWLQQLALRRADAVIAVSRPLVEGLCSNGIRRERIHLIANGFLSLTDSLPRAEARTILGIPDHELRAGWVGRLSREKGPDVMIEALAQTAGEWRLSVIGDGPERSGLQKLAGDLRVSDRVTWHGRIAGAARLLPAFDAFVLSSRTEGTPIALLEAMNSGVPIVAANVGGVGDVVSPIEAILVPSEDPSSIASALRRIQSDPQSARTRVANARRKLAGSFDGETWLAKIDGVYRSITAGQNGMS